MSIWDNISKIAGNAVIPAKEKTKNLKKTKKDIRVDCKETEIILTRKGVVISIYILQQNTLSKC